MLNWFSLTHCTHKKGCGEGFADTCDIIIIISHSRETDGHSRIAHLGDAPTRRNFQGPPKSSREAIKSGKCSLGTALVDFNGSLKAEPNSSPTDLASCAVSVSVSSAYKAVAWKR